MSYIESISTRSAGRRRVISARRLQAGHARHGDVEDREVDVLASARSTASAPSAASATTSRSGCGVEDQAQALADDGVVVGQEDPGHQRRRSRSVRSRTDGAAARARHDLESGADEQRPLAHPPDARCPRTAPVIEPPSVVGHLERERVVARVGARARTAARAGVARDVGERLLATR